MTNPAPAAILEVKRRRHARRPPDRACGPGCASRPAAFGENSIEGIAAILTVGPYRWAPTRSWPTASRPTGSATGAYRAPGRAAGDVRARTAHRRAGRAARSSTRSPSAARTSSPPTTRWPTGPPGAASASTSASPGWPTIRSDRDRASLPDGEGIGLAAGAWPGGRQPASAICRLEADGRVTVVTGVVDISGTMTGFATIAAEGLGHRRRRRLGQSAPTRRRHRAPR